jgi:hypothetical protein
MYPALSIHPIHSIHNIINMIKREMIHEKRTYAFYKKISQSQPHYTSPNC